jgi:predicted small secreted protein
MNWNAVEAISSAIGAAGVIVTIVYLAYQIRHNTQSIEGQTEQALMTLEKEVYSMIAEHASVYRRGTSDMSDLDADEALQFEYIVAAEMSLVYSAFVQHRRKLISDEVWIAYVNGVQVQLEQRGYHQAWARLRNDYPRSFVAVIGEIKDPAEVTA